jgi:precorrin-2 dehydrogenase/sirohydrochlorin ferrochelatase
MPMRHYPLFVSLEGRACLVVGAGQVGLRKIRSLLDSGASRLAIIERGEPGAELRELALRPGVSLVQRDFAESDLEGMFLVIAATNSPEVNRSVGEACRARGILCNVVDAPELGSFIVPSSVRRGDLVLAVSTGGQSPALTKRIRKDLQERYGEEYASFLCLMGRLRPQVLALGGGSDGNAELFRTLAGSRLLEALRLKDMALARAELTLLLPADLHPLIPELLHGLA